MPRTTSIHQRIATRMSAVLVVIIVASAVLMGLAITRSGTDLLVKAATDRLAQESRLVTVRLEDILEAAQRDIEFIANSPAVQEVAGAINASVENADKKRRMALAKTRLQDMFAALLNKHPWYAQARLISVADDGMEVVRVENNNGQIVRVPAAELQVKGTREYFRETLDAPPGKVYWSEINLNREHGKIATPVQPVLRVAMPVAGHYGTPYGIVIINLDIRHVFDVVSAALPPDITLYIANDKGDYLYHPDPDRTFGFEHGQHFMMQDDFNAGSLPVGRATLILEDAYPAGTTKPVVAHLSRMSLKTRIGDNLLLALTRPREQILADVNKARQQSTSLIIPFILFSVAVVVWLVQVFTGPLGRMTREVSRYKPGKPFKLNEQVRNDEVGHLAKAFVRMARRIDQQVLQLEEQGKRFKSLFEAVPDAVVIIDENGSVEYSNPATERLFGYAPDDLHGRNINTLMPEPYHSHHDQYMKRYLDGGEAHIIGIGRKVVGLHKDGRTLPLYLSIGEFTLQGRRKFTGILHDISLQPAGRQQEDDND